MDNSTTFPRRSRPSTCEELFTEGPLRDAARAGCLMALDGSTSEIWACVEAARLGLEVAQRAVRTRGRRDPEF